jgi:hypothetical protein
LTGDEQSRCYASQASSSTHHSATSTSSSAPLSTASERFIFSPFGHNLFIRPAPDGNLEPFNKPAAFASTSDGYIVGDPSGRLLHGYSDELSQYGVSRLRLSNTTAMPATAVGVVLVPIDVGKGIQALIGFELNLSLYYVVTCLIEAQLPKLFLVKDLNAGIATLSHPANNGTIIGGKVNACGFTPWSEKAAW